MNENLPFIEKALKVTKSKGGLIANNMLSSKLRPQTDPRFHSMNFSEPATQKLNARYNSVVPRVRFHGSVAKNSFKDCTASNQDLIEKRPEYRHSNTMPYNLNSAGVIHRNKMNFDCELYDSTLSKDFKSHLQLARSLNPELDSYRMEDIINTSKESLSSVSSKSSTDDFLKLKMRYKKLKKKVTKQKRLISLIQAEYIELCKHAESTQEDHYKLETVLRKTIADYARTITKLRHEYELEPKSNCSDETSTLKACNAQMVSAFSVMQSISNKKNATASRSSPPKYSRSDSMPRMSNTRNQTNRKFETLLCSNYSNLESPIQESLNDSNGVLSTTFRKSLSKMSPRIAYLITQKITEAIKSVLTTYQPEEKLYNFTIESPTSPSSVLNSKIKLLNYKKIIDGNYFSNSQSIRKLSYSRKQRIKSQQSAIGDDELCDILHNIRALSPTTVRALSNLLHNHPLVD